MVWVLPFILFASQAIAQDRCNKLSTELARLDQQLFTQKASRCDSLKPADFGFTNLSNELTKYFEENLKCQTLGTVDAQLGTLETELALHEGLSDLRTQTVEGKRTLETASNWTAREQDLTRKFAKDVTLGAFIQEVLESSKLTELFAGDTRLTGWKGKLNSFCQTNRNKESQLCALWITHKTEGVLPSLEESDVFNFMDELRDQLIDGRLGADKKKSFLEMLQLERDGEPTNFKQYQSEMDKAKIYDTVKSNQTFDRNSDQVAFLRTKKLRIPQETDNFTPIRNLLASLSNTQDMLKVKTSLSTLNSVTADNLLRQEARIKARWSSLYQQLLASGNKRKDNAADVPCTSPGIDVKACMADVMTNKMELPSYPIALRDMYTSLDLQAKSLTELKLKHERCKQDDVIQAWTKSQTVPPECTLPEASANASLEIKRQMALKLRERMKQEQDEPLRFRQATFTAIQEECSGGVKGFDASAACMNLPGQVEFKPAFALMSESIMIFQEGLAPNSSLSESDCPPGLVGPNAVLCNLLYREKPKPTPNPAPNVTPSTLGTDAPERTSDPIVRETLVNTAAMLANQYAQMRMNQLYRPQTPFQPPLYRPMPYSQPISMSMSDYVMSTATFYGGYGRYYQCPSCGFGSGPSAFGSYWGLGGGSSTMGGSSLGGTSLSSTVFSGASAGFASF